MDRVLARLSVLMLAAALAACSERSPGTPTASGPAGSAPAAVAAAAPAPVAPRDFAALVVRRGEASLYVPVTVAKS